MKLLLKPGITVSRGTKTWTIGATPTTGPWQPVGGYIVGMVDVLVNGHELDESEYVATDGINVSLVSAVSNAEVRIKNYYGFQIANALQKSLNLGDLLSAAAARVNLGLANFVDKTVANIFTAVQTPSNDAATPTAISTTSSFNFTGDKQVKEITLTNAITVTFGAPTGIVEDTLYIFKLKAGDASARVFSWNAAYKFPGGVPPLTSGTTTSGGKDLIFFIGGPSNTLEYTGHQADDR